MHCLSLMLNLIHTICTPSMIFRRNRRFIPQPFQHYTRNALSFWDVGAFWILSAFSHSCNYDTIFPPLLLCYFILNCSRMEVVFQCSCLASSYFSFYVYHTKYAIFKRFDVNYRASMISWSCSSGLLLFFSFRIFAHKMYIFKMI